MIRVVTVGGESGSGRVEVARAVATILGWKMVDRTFIDEVARTARVDPELARQYDECVDPWFHRLRKALWHGGYEGVISTTEAAPFDADAMAVFSRRVVEEAANQGSCVVVGRGGQCVLQSRTDAFHVFIYAPRQERIARLRRQCGSDQDAENLMDSIDRHRQAYIRLHFGQDWCNPHLYDLMLCSSMGETAAARTIAAAVREQG
jgi:cytidylate kinase